MPVQRPLDSLSVPNVSATPFPRHVNVLLQHGRDAKMVRESNRRMIGLGRTRIQ